MPGSIRQGTDQECVPEASNKLKGAQNPVSRPRQGPWLRLLPLLLNSMAGGQNLLTPGPSDGLAVRRQGPRSRLCLRTRLLPALTRPPTMAGRRLRERGPAVEDGLDDRLRLRPARCGCRLEPGPPNIHQKPARSGRMHARVTWTCLPTEPHRSPHHSPRAGGNSKSWVARFRDRFRVRVPDFFIVVQDW